MADIKIIVDSSDVATATNRVDQLGSSGTVAQKGIDKAARGMNQFGAVAKNGGKKLNTFNMQIQQGGYQLQDFVVQLQSGTSFFTAFGQQGSQFAGVFGPQGAVIGAVIAIGSAIGGIGYRALTAASAVKDFKEQLEDTSSVMEEYISLASKADETFAGLFDSSMSALSLTSQAAKDLLLIAKTDALNSIRGLGKSLSDASTEAGFWASVMFNTDRVVTGNLLNIDTQLKGNITTWKQTGQQVQAFIDAVRGIESAESLDGMYQSALLARDLFKETVDVTGEMTDKQKAFWKELSTTILKLEMMGAASQAIASTWADFDLGAFGGEGPDLEANTKAREEAEKRVLKARRKAGEAYFKNEQAIQDAIHQVWVKNNAEQNKKRLNDLEAEKKSRRDVGEAYFKQEQENAAAILSQRIKNILEELKAKKDAEAAAMAIRRAAGEAYFRQESDIQDQIFQITIDRIMAEHEATVKAQENAVKLRRVAGQAYAREQQQLEDDIHQAVVDRILEEYEAKVKAERDAVNLRREAGLKYAREQQQLEDDIHQVRVDNILNEAALREATISAARAKFKAGAGQFGEASQDVAAQRLAELRKAYADSLRPDKTSVSKESDLEKLRYQVALETELLGKTEARQKVIQAIGITVDDSFPKTAAGLEEQINKNLELVRVEQERIDLANTIGSAMEDSLMSMVDGTKSVKDAFRDMAADIVRHLYKVLVVQKMINAFGGMMSGSSNPILKTLGGGLESYGSADGGGYTGNGPRSGGLDGKGGFMMMMHPRETVIDHTKGQQANTNGPTIVQNFNFSANGDDSVKKIIAQAAPQIAQMTKNSMLNDRRRGGTTKAVFG
jgi:hypothetical protein